MIGRLRGEIIDRTATSVVVDVLGVGYVVTVSAAAGLCAGDKVDLYVHTHVREDTLQLFGFASALDREVFNHLISVPNVGPVKAMGILATPAQEIISAVVARDAGKLGKLPGVGKKTAERLLVDLAEKLEALLPEARSSTSPSSSGRPKSAPAVGEDLVSALVNLGFRPAAAEDAARASLSRLGLDAELSALVREAIAAASR